jgi:hypothetical protein
MNLKAFAIAGGILWGLLVFAFTVLETARGAGHALVLLGHKRTFWCRIVLWDHASLRQAHKRSASRHI